MALSGSHVTYIGTRLESCSAQRNLLCLAHPCTPEHVASGLAISWQGGLVQGNTELAQAAGMSGGVPASTAAQQGAGTAAQAEPEGAACPAPAAAGWGSSSCPVLAAEGAMPSRISQYMIDQITTQRQAYE